MKIMQVAYASDAHPSNYLVNAASQIHAEGSEINRHGHPVALPLIQFLLPALEEIMANSRDVVSLVTDRYQTTHHTKDIVRQPENLQAVDSQFLSYVQSLIADVEVDLDAPLSAEDE